MSADWPLVRLGDVVDLVSGFPFSSRRYTDDLEGIRLIRGDNVVQGGLRWDGVKRWPKDETKGLEAYWLQPDDVILAMDRPWISAGLKYAAVSNSDLPALLVQRVSRLRGTERLLTRYLKYVIGSQAFTDYVLAIQTGTGIPHISGGQIRAFEFRPPPLPEQRGIADVLGTMDDKIAANESATKAIFDFARAIPQSMIRKATSIERVMIKDVAAFVRGASYASSELAPSDTALLSLKAFRRTGGFRPDGLKPFTGRYKPTQVVESSDAVVAQTDLTQGAEVVGRVIRASAGGSFVRLVASMDLGILRPRRAGLTPEFLFAVLASDVFRQHCRARANGSTVLHLANGAVLGYEFDLPDQATIDAVTAVVRTLWDQHDALANESSALIKLRDELLPSLVSGRISVRPDEAAA